MNMSEGDVDKDCPICHEGTADDPQVPYLKFARKEPIPSMSRAGNEVVMMLSEEQAKLFITYAVYSTTRMKIYKKV